MRKITNNSKTLITINAVVQSIIKRFVWTKLNKVYQSVSPIVFLDWIYRDKIKLFYIKRDDKLNLQIVMQYCTYRVQQMNVMILALCIYLVLIQYKSYIDIIYLKVVYLMYL